MNIEYIMNRIQNAKIASFVKLLKAKIPDADDLKTMLEILECLPIALLTNASYSIPECIGKRFCIGEACQQSEEKKIIDGT